MTKKEKAFIVDMMEQHEQFLYQVAYRRLGDRELAKDMVQETFLTLTAKVDQVIVHKISWMVVQNIILSDLQRTGTSLSLL